MDVRSTGLETIKTAPIEPNNNWSSPNDPSVISDWRNCSEAYLPNKFGKQHSLQDLFAKRKDEDTISVFQRGRSNSDGAAASLVKAIAESPSRPSNALLEKWGLYGDTASREQMTEDSVEQKFTTLALACTIDATTIKDRCERQRRTRDQTESNFNLEVEKLKSKLALLQPLCTDFETADLLSTLFAQVEILTKAASLVAITAERFGAVQHEERLTESVQLMVSHVQALKQQRDSARRQLQYTKRVLQDPVQPSNPNNQRAFSSFNKKLITKRRASTDSVNFSNQQSDPNFKLSRRISDGSFRVALTKTLRPSRLDLGMELNKIKEMAPDECAKETLETHMMEDDVIKDDFDSDLEVNEQVKNYSNPIRICYNEPATNKLSNLIRTKLSNYMEHIQKKLSDIFKKWSENGYMHAFLNCCAVLCFSISVLTLVSIFLEQDYAKGPTYWLFPSLKREN